MIDIVGAGAMGLLYSAKLIAAECPVRIWTRTAEQAQLLRDQGLKLELPDGEIQHLDEIYAYPLEQAVERLKLEGSEIEKLALFVKQTHWTDELLGHLHHLPVSQELSIVCFQNGIGHMEILKRVWTGAVLLSAVTTEAAKRIDAHHVIHTGQGTTYIGSENNQVDVHELAEDWNNLLNIAGIQASVSNNIEGMIYQKLLINAVINPLTAILRIRNGELLNSTARIELMRAVFAEVRDIYAALQIEVGEQDWKIIEQVCERTASNTSSMLADVLQHRQTEIEAITGALLRLAEQHGVDAPVQRSLYLLVRALDPN